MVATVDAASRTANSRRMCRSQSSISRRSSAVKMLSTAIRSSKMSSRKHERTKARKTTPVRVSYYCLGKASRERQRPEGPTSGCLRLGPLTNRSDQRGRSDGGDGPTHNPRHRDLGIDPALEVPHPNDRDIDPRRDDAQRHQDNNDLHPEAGRLHAVT